MKNFFMQKDKQLHIAAGFIISIIVIFFTKDIIAGFFVGALVGILKEIVDVFLPKRVMDTKDALATAIGAAAGMVVGYIFTVF